MHPTPSNTRCTVIGSLKVTSSYGRKPDAEANRVAV